MKKILAVLLLLLLTVLEGTVCAAETNENNAWVLCEVVDNDAKDLLAMVNSKVPLMYKFDVNYSRGHVNTTETYMGETDKSTTLNGAYKIHGATASIESSWSSPPQVIAQDAVVQLELSVSLAGLSNGWPTPNGTVTASVVKISKDNKIGEEIGTFYNDDNEYWFETSTANQYASFDETVTAKVKGSSQVGDRIAIRITGGMNGITTGTTYIYEWTAANTAPAAPTPKSAAPVMPSSQPTADPNRKDYGARFSDLYGEVSVRPNSEDNDAYELAEIGMILYHDDRIRTRAKSGATITFADLSSFVMGPNSEIVLDIATEHRSMIKLVAGNILGNIRKMINGESMDVEMSQGSLGIKGTVFVCEQYGQQSTVKVLEGSVEFTPTGKEPVSLNAGESLSVSSGVAGGVKTIQPEIELAQWDEKTQAMVNDRLREQGVRMGESASRQTGGEADAPEEAPYHPIVWLIGLAAIVVAAGAAAVLLLRKKSARP